jgi:hypothetical protein
MAGPVVKQRRSGRGQQYLEACPVAPVAEIKRREEEAMMAFPALLSELYEVFRHNALAHLIARWANVSTRLAV